MSRSSAGCRRACDARDRAADAARANLDDTQRDATVAIILSAAAAEGFINEVAAFVSEMVGPGGFLADTLTAQWTAFASLLNELEEGHASPKVKYLAASVLLGRPFDKGQNPFQDFALLMRLRDDHMHLKPKASLRAKGQDFVMEPPPYIKGFQGRGLARTFPADVSAPWISHIQTAEMAKWAVVTARSIIHAVLDMSPDSDGSFRDPFGIFKLALTSSPGSTRP
jgi:hypothetical protein